MVRNVVKNMSVVGVAMLSTSTNSNSKTTLKLSSMEKEKEKEKEGEWEKRPGGMLVQKRTDDVAVVSVKCIRVRVAYGSARYEISISSQATFGELKKLLTVQSGLHYWEQRITYKGKEKEDKQFLDICGVKDRSKLILTEDPCSREKRLLEMHKNDKLQRAQRAIAEVASEVDSLADLVSGIEKSVGNGVKVAEVRISTLIELLMRQAVKLDSIISAGIEVSALNNLQGKRVQKCVETLDMLKISNASLKPVVVTAKWETFDPSPTTTTTTSHYWNLLD
ncbi:BAG family molecular chaperone regulator 3-like [Silene latifolia]|uniref:BAG family molecular chaperone regulator 3-like n=1 Tax=Silene latifolia TaxID=37657 RepID=UPI003D780847